jgi:hypothetical protein
VGVQMNSNLSDAFKNLTSIDFDGDEISSDQIQAIFMDLKDDAEVKFEIVENTIFGIEGLESILHRLTVFMTDGLLRHWMEILDKSCKLKCLELCYVDVTKIPKQMRAMVVNKIERVNLFLLSVGQTN